MRLSVRLVQERFRAQDAIIGEARTAQQHTVAADKTIIAHADRTRDLARRAAQLLGAAGVRAIQRGDAVASSRLLERCQTMWRQPTQANPLESLPGDA